MKKLIICICISVLFLLSANVGWSCVYMNDFELAFQPPDNGMIANDMIDGSANFLHAYSMVLIVLHEKEKAEKDFPPPVTPSFFLESAISKLELSRNHYSKAISRASKTDYVPYRIDQLKNFDYNKFCSENKLNGLLMEEVKQYLVNGDVTGLYRKNLEFVEQCLSTLHDLKEALKTTTTPDMSLYWEMIRSFSETVLFGNYATSVAKHAFGLD